MIGVLTLWFTMAHADCTGAYSTDLTRTIGEAEATFSDLDINAFRVATDRLDALLPCLRDPVTRDVAAQVHRFLGIRAFAEGDVEQALEMFAAGRALEPDFVFAVSLLPSGSPIRQAYEQIDTATGAFETAPSPAGGYLHFDGRLTNQRPRSWATLVQRFDDTGRLVQTVYLMPSDPLPSYAVEVGEPVAVIPYVDLPVDRDRRKGLIEATVVGGLATGLLYTWAGVTEARFKNPSTPDAQLDTLARRANTLSIASAVTGTATLGLGVGVVLRF